MPDTIRADRPNVLVFIPHDLGDTLHCYGHTDVRSPNLDALAARGVRFSNCFTTSPECTPSRGGLWTGLYPHQNGLMGLSNFGWSYAPGVKPLARRLGEAGYATHLFGLQHEGPDPAALGYAHAHAREDRRVGPVCDEVIRFLESGEARGGAPWFACAGFGDVHRPWRSPSTFDPASLRVPPYLPDNPTIRNDLALFYQNILEMDAAVGRVLDALAASEAGANTLVVFTTDHGAGFPRAKATLYDPGLRVPLLMHWPGMVEGGREHDCLLSNLDVTPTLLAACGCEAPEALAGRGFLPLLLGGAYEERDQVCGTLLYDVAYDPMHYVRTRTHKYIRSFAVTPEEAAGADPEVLCTFEAGEWVRVDDFDVMSGAAWKSMQQPQPKPPPEELYDLRSDPWEQANLIGGDAAVDADMRTRLRRFMQDTHSPLLNGHVPPPPEQREANRKYRPGGPMYRR